jgi:hypothetical protein
MDHRRGADALDFLLVEWRRLVAHCPINFRASQEDGQQKSVRETDNVIGISPVGVSYRGPASCAVSILALA